MRAGLANLTLLALLGAPQTAFSTPLTSLDALKTHWGSTLGGIATTVALHELGHFAAAEFEGSHAYFDGITVRYEHNSDLSDKEKLRLSSAGFHAQWLASEYGFFRLEHNQSLTPRSSSFHAGMVLGHLGITLAYAIFLKNHQDGDLRPTARLGGISQDKALLALLIPAALDSWRLFGNAPRWVPWVSRSSKAVGIGWSWWH